MADDDKSFKELLSEASLAADTVTVVGALVRTHEPDKFVLTLADGHSVTLETKAVKSFTRLGGAIGQLLVQLELDAKLVPIDLYRQTGGTAKLPSFDFPRVVPTLWESIQIKPPNDPLGLNPVGSGTVNPVGVFGGGGTAVRPEPFALATPHQAPAETRAALQFRYKGVTDQNTGGYLEAATGWEDTLTGILDGLGTGPWDWQ